MHKPGAGQILPQRLGPQLMVLQQRAGADQLAEVAAHKVLCMGW